MSLLLCTNWGLLPPGYLAASTAASDATEGANCTQKYWPGVGPQKATDASSRRTGAAYMDTGVGLSPSAAIGVVQFLNADRSPLAITYPRTLYLGFAARFTTYPSTTATDLVGPWGLFSTLVSGGYYFPAGAISNGDGTMSVGFGRTYDSTSSIFTVEGTSAAFLARDGAAHWYFIELKVVITNATTWQVELKVDGTVRVALTSSYDPTGLIASPDVYGAMFFSDAGAINTSVSDVYMLDNQGSVNNSYLGDCRVESLRPSGAGGQAQWTTVGAGSATAAVNDTTNDLDAGYLLGPAPTLRSTFTLDDLASTTGTVRGVMVHASAKKEGSNARVIKPAVRVSGVTYDGAAGDFSPYQGGYRAIRGVFDTNPATSATWTATAVNALEAGVSLTA